MSCGGEVMGVFDGRCGGWQDAALSMLEGWRSFAKVGSVRHCMYSTVRFAHNQPGRQEGI